MGNAAATLAITIDQPAVYSGGQLTGRVYMQVNKPIDATALQIELGGEEYAHVHWTTHEGTGDKSRTVHHHAYRRRSLISVTVNLANFASGEVQPGQYEFPFSLTMPGGLPTSMCASGGGGDCKVHYWLKSRLYRPEWYQFDVRAKRGFYVSAEPFPPEPVPFFAYPSTVPVKMCCCIQQGEMTLGCMADDTRISRGEMLGVGIALDNQSKSKVDTISVQIKEYVVWRAAGHVNRSCRTIGRASFDPAVIAGAAKKTKTEMQAADGDPNSKSAGLAKMYATLSSGSQRSTLMCAPDARDTYVGSVLAVNHRMFAQAGTACCVTNPELDLPVRIGPPPLAPAPAPAAMITPVATPVPVAAPVPAAAPVPGYAPNYPGYGPDGRRPPVVMAVPVIAMPMAMPMDKEERASAKLAAAKPDGWESSVVVAEAVALPMGEAVVGGEAGHETEAEPEDDGSAAPTAALELLPPGSLEALHQLFDRSLDDKKVLLDIVLSGEKMAVWRPLLASLTPEQFGRLVAKFSLDFDKPELATILAAQLAAPGLTSAHVVNAVRGTNAYKAQLVRRVAPMVSDLASGRASIEAELSDWERILSRDELNRALGSDGVDGGVPELSADEPMPDDPGVGTGKVKANQVAPAP